MDTPAVKVGQIWADNDPRSEGRTLRVDQFENGWRYDRRSRQTVPVRVACCTVLTPANEYPDAPTGHCVKIRVDRMQPTSTGYRLVSDADEGAKDGAR